MTVPSTHITAVARAQTQKKRIRLVKATGMEGERMGELLEKQLVEKANLALGLMEGGEERRPTEVKFVGANKERSTGGVIYELNLEEVAGWLREKETMVDFLLKMGSTADFKDQTYEVVVDWILISFELDLTESWRVVELVDDMKVNTIKGLNWIKPIHIRALGQRTAIAVFRMSMQEDANQIIRRGVFIEGKKVWGRKQMQEPRRCLKCQCFGEHKAGECRSIHNVCGHCGNHHRTSLCDKSDKDELSCSNCLAAKNSKHIGHGAVDRRCLIFLAWLEKNE